MKVSCPHCKNQFEHFVKPRSNNQNRYAHGIALQTLSDYTGFTVQEVKEVLKKEFGFTRLIELNGKTVEVLRSTADFSSAEFEDFMSKTRMFAAQMGCMIPEPNSPNLVDKVSI